MLKLQEVKEKIEANCTNEYNILTFIFSGLGDIYSHVMISGSYLQKQNKMHGKNIKIIITEYDSNNMTPD